MSPLEAEARWADAALAVELLATAPRALGGLLVTLWAGPVRDRLGEWVRSVAPGPLVRLPLHATEDRLLGGVALAETLQQGRVVLEPGLFTRADGGLLLVPSSERLPAPLSALLSAALDEEALSLQRDGAEGRVPCRFALVAFDEGLGDEATPVALRDRLAVHLDLREVPLRHEPGRAPEAARVRAARARLPTVDVDDAVVTALSEAALALGVLSVRATIRAVAVARAHAALEGRARVGVEDAAAAARLVLGPRATRVPPAPPEEEPAESGGEGGGGGGGDGGEENDPSTAEVLLAAARSAIPPGVLELVALGKAQRTGPRSSGKGGAARESTLGGRPAGSRAGVPQAGERLSLVDTLRAAAPWQRLRRTVTGARLAIRKDDLRLRRFVQRTESVVIFCVDASGSLAMQRLAEAKGAVEQVLSECYVRRDQVALLAFRGSGATLLLPPTRSLTRARRCLAELAGGGGTPIAAGIDAATGLALEIRRRGRSPLLVFMTDGRANVGRPGAGDVSPQEEALQCARRLRAQQVRTLFLDTSPRPRPLARALALEMGAHYLALPRLDADVVSSQVQQLTR